MILALRASYARSCSNPPASSPAFSSASRAFSKTSFATPGSMGTLFNPSLLSCLPPPPLPLPRCLAFLISPSLRVYEGVFAAHKPPNSGPTTSRDALAVPRAALSGDEDGEVLVVDDAVDVVLVQKVFGFSFVRVEHILHQVNHLLFCEARVPKVRRRAVDGAQKLHDLVLPQLARPQRVVHLESKVDFLFNVGAYERGNPCGELTVVNGVIASLIKHCEQSIQNLGITLNNTNVLNCLLHLAAADT
eukprot:CAMPEP_0171903958 /NCGR_PEP_ID=MMETSP0993-20121228/3672_1 /TAXON_ID=483369 /ORGANISM="non described non described, Strain CCMP2098" /LENGTH=246 /DNA_ID=CAMNT_0012534607 /DNA_START=218 /DNA_END=959 /DNA_ORIENTATION=+